MKKRFLYHNEMVLLASFFYLISVFIVSPFGNYIVNDEWIFFRQIEAFTEGIFRINSQIDPTFILQGIAGFGWSELFGFSFNNLHVLTIVTTLVFIISLYLILKELKISNYLILFTLLLIIFNPLIFHLSFVFMTEIYFLTAVSWAVYFYLRYKKTALMSDILLMGGFIGAAILIRQTGLILFLIFVLAEFKDKNKKFLQHFVSAIPVVLAILGYILWPRYSEGSFGLFEKLGGISSFVHYLPSYIFSIFYYSFFVFPMVWKTKIGKYAALVPVIAIPIYLRNVFPIGNVIYLEGLLSKNTIIFYLSFFNNPVFKALMSALISVTFVKLVFTLKETFKKIDSLDRYLIFSFIGFFCINFLVGDFYDRYLVVSFLFLTIYLAKQIKRKRTSLIGLLFLAGFSIIMQKEYLIEVKNRWVMAHVMQEETGKLLTLGVDSAYGKYFKAKKTKEYSGFVYPNPTECCSCRVDQYSAYKNTEDTKFSYWMHYLNPHIRRIPETYAPPGTSAFEIFAERGYTMNQILYENSYEVFSGAIVGRTNKTIGWCD